MPSLKSSKLYTDLGRKKAENTSHKRPIHKREGEAVHRVFVGCKHLPDDGLLVRDMAPHCRHADTTRQVSKSLQIRRRL